MLDAENVDYFVGHTLDKALRELVGQALRLQFVAGDDVASDEQRDRPSHRATVRRATADDPAHCWKPISPRLTKATRRVERGRDPGALSRHHGYLHYRLAHTLFGLGATSVGDYHRIVHRLLESTFIPGATIKGSFFIDHGTGVVIGETAIIGQHVAYTTGHARREAISGRGRRHHYQGETRAPDRGRRGRRYANATILGRITIGRGSVIGGNVWLTQASPRQQYCAGPGPQRNLRRRFGHLMLVVRGELQSCHTLATTLAFSIR